MTTLFLPKLRSSFSSIVSRIFSCKELIMMLFLPLLPANGQMLADFESPAASPPFTAEAEYGVVANPDPAGINPSDSVGYYHKISGNWHFVNLQFPDTVKIRYANTLTFKLRTTTQGRIFAKFWNGNDVVIENWCPSWNFRPAPDTWVECTMDLTAAMGKQFTMLQLAACVDNTAEADVWFDDIRLSNPDAGDGTPVLSLVPSATTLTLGSELTLDASDSYDFDGEIVDYAWDLGDGNTGSGPLLTHTYAAGGNFTVTLTVTDNDGKSATGTSEIFVIPLDQKTSELKLMTPEPVTHRKTEFVFQTRKSYQNPYDPDEVKIDAVVVLPGGDSMVVPCFFQVPVSFQNQEWVADPVHSSWMLRFSSDRAGSHSVRLKVEDADGTWISDPVNLQIRQGDARGRIVRDPVHPQYFRHTTGEPFYPLGINIGWNSIENYTTIMSNLSAGGASVFRYWQTPFNWQGLEWSEDYYYNYEGLGRYNQEASARNDSLLELCDSLDLYMQLCIFQHGQFSENVDDMWDSNPYNTANGGYVERAEEYFYNGSCRMQTQKLLRYIVARWGYSRNLFAWEFFNEVQFTGNHNSQSDLWWPGVVDWHGEMSRYVESIDPWDHLMTTSAAVGQLASLDTIRALDNLQYHIYEDEESLLVSQVNLDRRFLGELEHTSVINGEYGTSNGADTPFDMQRSAIWNGIMTQVPRYMWIWEHYLDPEWAHLFSMPARFLAGEDLASEQEPAPYTYQVTHPAKTFRTLGLATDSLFTGYLYDPDYASDISGATLTLEGLPVANYSLSWWLPESDQVIVTDSLPVIEGTCTLDLPTFSKGIAFKLKYHSAYMLPLADAGNDTTVAVGSEALLTGRASTSPSGDTLAYLWHLISVPGGSQVILEDSTSMEVAFTPDLPGIYLLSLVVSDSTNTSVADRVTVKGSLPPVAVAGNDTVVSVDEMYVRIDGAGSYDPDGDPLSYAWVLLDAPAESERVIYEDDAHEVILLSDVPGVFMLELTVGDGSSLSEPDTVLVTVLEHGTGLDPTRAGSMLELYPNPSDGTVYLRSGSRAIRQIEILDLQGRILGLIPHPSGTSGLIRLEINRFVEDSGLVFLRITGEGFTIHLPLLIQ